MSPVSAPVQPERPAYRLYAARLVSLSPLSPNFIRVRLSCEDFAHFGTGRRDQRIKVIFPNDDGAIPDLGPLDPADMADAGWYGRWRDLPDAVRPPFRTYTVREIDREARHLDIDFVVHGDTSVSGRWLSAASPGDEVYVAGPDGRSAHHESGIDFHPGGATRLLLAGDETAVPAIAAILERLPRHLTVRAFCEVPTAEDVLDLATGPEVDATWLSRDGREHGAPLIEALDAFVREHPGYLAQAKDQDPDLDDGDDEAILWDVAHGEDGGFYAWLAGEAGAVKRLRRILVTEHRVDRRSVAFMGYWRLGRSET